MESISTEIYLIAGITIFAVFVSTFILLILNLYQKKQRIYRQEKKQLESNFQEEILRTRLEIQEQTLKNIGEEIHDNIGQTLSLVKLNLNTLNLEQQEKAEEKIVSSKELVGKAITDLRLLSKTLHTDLILKSGLLKAVETELQMIDKAADISTAFIVTGAAEKIDAQKELILFRTVQEALNNALKHSGATKISVRIDYSENELLLTVMDNGKGFVTAPTLEGLGMQTMQNRVQLIGGNLDIKSNEQNGTEVQIKLAIN